MANHSLSIQLKDIPIRVNTNNPDYHAYLKTYFSKIIASGRDPGKGIFIDVAWEKKPGLLRLEDDPELRAIGANTLVGPGKIATQRKIGRKTKIWFAYKFKEGVLELRASLKRKPLKDFMRYGVLGKAQEPYFFELTYPLVYYPAFWYFECLHNTHPLHASAVKIGNRCILICGLEGSGKTTLSLELSKEKGAQQFSDNLVLHDEKHVFPCYEPIRIHKADDASSFGEKLKKINEFKTQKDFYEPVGFDLGLKGSPDTVLIPSFGKEFAPRKISQEECANMILNINNLTAELGNYNEFAHLLNLMEPAFNLAEARLKALKALISAAACYEVTMRKADGIQSNIRKVKDLLSRA